MSSKVNRRHIYDNIHGQITLNRVESRILESPYYQRLRWIKQLGFSFYIFPGATHTRHAHTLGVLHMMDRVLNSIGKATTEEKLFNPKVQDEPTIFHRTLRLAAMLHDIGTMPFSHTIELAYINYWRQQQPIKKAKYFASHETLGSHIILNTDFEGGLTKILKEEGIDPQLLASIINGESPIMLANQLMHSDIDVDRMDYLMRDAYHTGVRLGIYDNNLMLKNLSITNIDGDEYLAIREDAIHIVESFLTSRYFWYSQIINDGTGYKFDLIAAKIYEYFLENGLAYSFDQLMDRVSQNPNEYFTFNDSYFMAKLHEYLAGRITHPLIRELAEMIARRVPPAQIKIPPVSPTLIQSEQHRLEVIDRVQKAMNWLVQEMKEVCPNDWIINDIPTRDVIFTKSNELLKKDKTAKSNLKTRDSVKVLTRQGEARLLIDMSHSILSILSQYRNFIPRIYVSPTTFETLEKKGVLKKMHEQFNGVS